MAGPRPDGRPCRARRAFPLPGSPLAERRTSGLGAGQARIPGLTARQASRHRTHRAPHCRAHGSPGAALPGSTLAGRRTDPRLDRRRTPASAAPGQASASPVIATGRVPTVVSCPRPAVWGVGT